MQHRPLTQPNTGLQPEEVLVADAGFSVAALLTESVSRFVVRVARHFTARRNVLPAYKGRGRCPTFGERVRRPTCTNNSLITPYFRRTKP